VKNVSLLPILLKVALNAITSTPPISMGHRYENLWNSKLLNVIYISIFNL